MSSAQLEECAFGHLESAGLTTILGTTPDGRAIDLVETAPSGLMLLDAAEAGFLVGGPDFVAIDCAAMAALGLSDSELPLRRAAEALGYHGAVPEGLRIKGIAAENPRTPVAARPPAAQATGDAEATVVLDEARCRQHRVCAEVCPTGTVECGMRNGLPRRSPVRSRAECGTGGTKHHAARCILCCECVEHCPEGARAPVAAPGAVTEPVALATKPAGWLAALTQPASTGSAGLGPWTRPPAWQRPRKLGKPLTILGLSMTTQQHHAAALLRDGRVVGAVEEERLRRLKQYGWFPPGRPGVTVVADPSIPLEEAFPWRAVNWLLREAGLTLDDIDIFAVNGIPGRFSRSYSRTDPSRPPKPLRSGRFLFIPHHLSHAASAVRFGGMRDGFAFTVDGRGERETAAFFEVEDGIIRQVFDVLVNEDSLIGGVYETITQILGFGKFGQGSTMGLAALGRPGFDMARCLAAASHLDTRIHQEAAFREFSHLKRGRDGAMTDEHIRLAASVQDALEKLAIGLLEEGLAGRRAHTLALAGGVALNCRMNQSIRHRFGIEKMVMQPAMHDAGTALGAALEAHWMLTGEYPSPEDAHAYHGPGYSDDHIRSVLEASRVPWTRSDDIALDTARLVADGQVVCWFQGRLEFGPRALGTRSILADPRSRTLKDRINILKGRQWWRPFGPSILEGHEADYFVHPIVSPFMLFTLPVRKDKWDEIPAVLHVDQTTRPQSVNERTNPLYYATIREFQKLTGIPMVLNTSFNTASEPIVCSPEGALSSFLQLGADYLAIGDYLVERVAIDHPPSHDASAGLRRPSAFARRFGGTSATIVRDGCSGQSRLDSPPSARSVEQAPVGSQRLMLRLTTRCNNRCEHCTIADIAHFPEKEAAAALAEITRARRDGCTELVFMRGEAPLRRDLLPLVTRARAMGYRHIQVQTNGRLFAYEKAVRAFLEAGVSFFEVSLYGDCAGLHDAVAQVQGAFEQTAAGLRNLAHANASLLVTVPIVKRNFTRLSDIVDCAKALGANRVQLNFPRPVRVENRWIHAPLVRLAEASPFVRKALDKAFELGMEAGTEAIPLCHLAPEQRESAGECGDFGRFQAVDVHRRTESLGAAREQSRPRTTSCSSCPLVSSCPTTWKAYQDLFGTRELNPRGT
jgi:carbamoyltransferase